jgi:hypothetical protein
MTGIALTDDQVEQTIAAVAKHRRPDGSINWFATAKELGLGRSTVQHRVASLAKQGRMGFEPVLPSFIIRRVSTQHDETGKVVKRFVQQGPAPGKAFSVPAGHQIKGVSALLDADNRIVAQWVKTNKDAERQAELIDAIKATFDGYKGRAELPPKPHHAERDLLTVYNLGDHHLGLMSWGVETGANYDLKIAERVLLDTMSRLVASAPSSETAIVLNLGDFVHSDSQSNRTEKSGHPLDVDGRYAKVLQTGVRLLVDCVELALAKHQRVIVRNLPGNHDFHTSFALTAAIGAFFHANDRVTVDCDPSKFFWHVHGRVFIGATHGDMVKPNEMPGVMASMRPREWGDTDFRYAYFGHVHHSSKGGGENHGIIWETFQVLAGKDAWHHASGYSSGRSMTAIHHHKEFGEYSRNTVSIPPRPAG